MSRPRTSDDAKTPTEISVCLSPLISDWYLQQNVIIVGPVKSQITPTPFLPFWLPQYSCFVGILKIAKLCHSLFQSRLLYIQPLSLTLSVVSITINLSFIKPSIKVRNPEFCIIYFLISLQLSLGSLVSRDPVPFFWMKHIRVILSKIHMYANSFLHIAYVDKSMHHHNCCLGLYLMLFFKLLKMYFLA